MLLDSVEVRHRTLPELATVVDTRDRVLRGVTSALEHAGMTIPWPIRTLAFDTTREHAPAEPA